MNILLANYRYFISGGPERYMFNVIDELGRRKHSIVTFSVKYNQNIHSEYEDYYVEPIGSRDDVYFNQHNKKMKLRVLTRTLSRLFYSREVENAVVKLTGDTKPDIAYVLHYLRKLSPSVLVGLKKQNIPIVVRLSDYGMLCPQFHFLRDDNPCRLCLDGSIVNSMKYRCVQHSFMASSLNAFATWFHKTKDYFGLIDAFVTTNSFMSEMMISGGFPEEKIHCIPTFTNVDTFKPSKGYQKSDYFVYLGRLTHEKGVHILIDALKIIKNGSLASDIKLKIIGDGPADYLQMLKEKVVKGKLEKNVDFIGRLDEKGVVKLLNHSLFSVVPSLWFENLPNAVLESYACGTPVIASNLGSLAHCVKDGSTGFLFSPGDKHDLAEKMESLLNNPELLKKMTTACRNEAVAHYSSDAHCQALIGLFNRLI